MKPENKNSYNTSDPSDLLMLSTSNDGYNQHNNPYLLDPRKFNDRWYAFRDNQLIDGLQKNNFRTTDPIINTVLSGKITPYMGDDEIRQKIRNTSKEELISGVKNYIKDRLNTVKIYDVDHALQVPKVHERLAKIARKDGIGSGTTSDIKSIFNDTDGMYQPSTHSVIIKNMSDESTLIHELNHSLGNTLAPFGVDNNILSPLEYYDNPYLNTHLKMPINDYLDSPGEIVGRLMEFRGKNKINPLHKYTIEEVKNMRKDPKIKDYDLLKRYDDEMMLILLNKIAQTTPKSNNLYKKV